MSYTATTFLAKFKTYAIADMKSSGILASLTGAQGFIESNKGNSGLTTKANNLFGIKGSYNGQSVTMQTTEYYNGVATKVDAAFRKYPSWQESVNDHSALFNRLSRYSNLRGEQDFKQACINVRKDGYATSPTYTTTLHKTITTYKLYLWDYEVVKDYTYDKLDTVKNGSYGGTVYLLQTLLGISADAIAGAKTVQAIKDFQTKNGLTVDGICGKNTWKALKG